jgi:hypothetical protein
MQPNPATSAQKGTVKPHSNEVLYFPNILRKSHALTATAIAKVTNTRYTDTSGNIHRFITHVKTYGFINGLESLQRGSLVPTKFITGIHANNG